MKATVKKIIQETHDVKSWILKLEGPMDYKTSQFVMVNLDEKRFGKKIPQLAYSIACPPNKNEIMITARIHEGGTISPYLNQLKVDEEIEIKGPYGKFIYEGGKTTLIGAGTGIAPLYGIMHCALNDGQDVELYYSDRTEKDLIYKDELEKLAEEDRIKLYLFVTREPGHDKYITKRIGYDFLESNLKKDGFFYVCGPPKFVENIIKNLERIGISKEQIKKEEFN